MKASEEAHSLKLSDEEDEGISEEQDDLKIQLEVLKNDIREMETKNQELEDKTKEFDSINEELKLKLEGSRLKNKLMEEKEVELIASNAMLSEELELKVKFIEELTETKVNAEMGMSKIKHDLMELRSSCQQQSDENQELKDELRKTKEKLEKKKGELDTIALELKLRLV